MIIKFILYLVILFWAVQGYGHDLRVTFDVHTKNLVLETPSSGKKIDLVLLEKPIRVNYCLIQYTAGESVLFLNVQDDSSKDHFYQLIQPQMEGKEKFDDLGEFSAIEFDPFLYCSSLQAYCMKDLDCPLEEGSALLKYVHGFTCRFKDYEVDEVLLQDGKMTADIELDWAMLEVVKRAYKKRYPKGIPPKTASDGGFIRETPWFWLDGHYPLHTSPRPFDLPSVPLRSGKGGHVYVQVRNKPLNVPVMDKDEVVVVDVAVPQDFNFRTSGDKTGFETSTSSSATSRCVISLGQGSIAATSPETRFNRPILNDLRIIQKFGESDK